MEGKKDRVTYTVTIKGDDGSEKVLKTQSFFLTSIVDDNSQVKVIRYFQAHLFDMINLYASIIETKDFIEKRDKLVPALYEGACAIGAIKKRSEREETEAMDGGAV